MLEADERDTALLFRQFHNTARVFRNAVAKEAEAIAEAKGSDLEFTDLAHLVNGKRGRKAEAEGDSDGGIWTAGPVVGLIDDLPTVRELVERMVLEAEEVIRGRLHGILLSTPPLARL